MRILITCLIVTLAGCSYPLAGGILPLRGQDARDVQLDQLTCARQAEQHGGADAAGWIPIAGIPMERHIRREEFKNCMEEKGYKVLPVATAAPIGPAAGG